MIADAESSTRTGRKGGRSRTPAKALAAKQNILLRWHPRDESGTIPIKALLDGAWYQGTGRTGPVALWDGEAQLFRTIGVQSWPDPTRYPAIRRRITGLKTEKHVQMQGGTFSPQSVLAR